MRRRLRAGENPLRRQYAEGGRGQGILPWAPALQPTRGIDVGATEFVRNKIVELRDAGTAVLLISADLNEILELSDSLIVMHNGEVAAYLPDSSQVTETELGEYMLGIRRQGDEEIRRVCHGR